MKHFDGNVNAAYLSDTAKLMEDIKRRSYEHMAITPGNVVCDIGCGPAVDTIPLARIVGKKGSVTGVDSDPEMLSEADTRARAEGLESIVRHIRGEAEKLPFPDGTFDAVRAERLIQVLPPAAAEPVFAEIIRVLKKGGRAVMVDTDWGSATVDYPDSALERRLVPFFAAHCRPNGFAGRELVRLFARSGCLSLSTEIIPFVTTDFAMTTFGPWLTREVLAHGIATPDEMNRWNTTLEERSRKGEFFSSVNIVIVSGTKS